MEKFKYQKPKVPENEIEMCLEMFDKKEAKKRICEFIKNTIDDVEWQIKRHETIHNVVCILSGKTIEIPKSESPCKSCKNDDGYLQCLNCKSYNQYQNESIWNDL